MHGVSERPVLKALGVILLGMLGMGLFQAGGCLVDDLRWLHTIKIANEAALARQAAAAAPE